MRRTGGRPAAFPLSPAHGTSLATTAGITSVISGVLVVGLLAQSPAEALAGVAAGCLALAAFGLYVARNRVCRALDLVAVEPESAGVWGQRAQAMYHAAMAAWFAGLGAAAIWRLGGIGWGVAAIAGCAVVSALGQALYQRRGPKATGRHPVHPPHRHSGPDREDRPMMLKTLALGLGTLLAAALAAGSQAIHLPAPAAAPAGKVWVTGVLSGVHVSDLETGKEIAKFDTGIIPHMMLVSPDKKRVLVSHIGSQNIAVFDTETVTKLKDILVGEMPDNAPHRKLGAARMAKATSCYECHKVVPTGTAPNAMAWTPDGRALMVSETKNRGLVWLDPETGKTLKRHTYDIPDRVTPAHILVHPVSQEIWVLHRFEDFMGDRFAKAHPTKPAYAGQHQSWITVHSPGFGREVARLKVDWEVPSTGAFSPDGRLLYISYRSSNRIGVFDTSSKRLLRSYQTAEAPTGLLLSPDGSELYVACPFSSPAVVQVLDARTGELKVSMGVPPSPLMLAQDPANRYLYATVAGYNAVLEIDRENYAIRRQFRAGHQPLDLVLTP